MFDCKRCGTRTPRLTLSQRYCPTCDAEVKAIMEADARRRAPRFSTGKVLTRLTSPTWRGLTWSS